MLGCTLQKSWYDPRVGRVWVRSPVTTTTNIDSINITNANSNTDTKNSTTSKSPPADDHLHHQDRNLQQIAGHIDWLTNSQVNLISTSSTMVSLVIGLVGLDWEGLGGRAGARAMGGGGWLRDGMGFLVPV